MWGSLLGERHRPGAADVHLVDLRDDLAGDVADGVTLSGEGSVAGEVPQVALGHPRRWGEHPHLSAVAAGADGQGVVDGGSALVEAADQVLAVGGGPHAHPVGADGVANSHLAPEIGAYLPAGPDRAVGRSRLPADQPVAGGAVEAHVHPDAGHRGGAPGLPVEDAVARLRLRPDGGQQHASPVAAHVGQLPAWVQGGERGLCPGGGDQGERLVSCSSRPGQRLESTRSASRPMLPLLTPRPASSCCLLVRRSSRLIDQDGPSQTEPSK